MVTEVTAAPFDDVANVAPCEVEPRVTVVAVAAVVGFPKASSSVTVIAPKVAWLDATPDTAGFRTSLAGGAEPIVTGTPEVADTPGFESTAVMEYCPAALRLQPENWTIPYDSAPKHVFEKVPGPDACNVTEEKSFWTIWFEAFSTATSACGMSGVPTVPPPGCTSHWS